MGTLRIWVRSFVFYTWFLTSNVVLFLGALVVFALTAPFDRRRRVLHRYTSLWGYHYVALSPLWRPTWEGREHIDPGGTYVLVANHQSLGDILLLFGLFKHFKWVSKAEIFRVPFIGWNMRMNDYVGLKRGSPGSIKRMMDHCRRHLAEGSSVMLFPEGTRSVDGELKPFKHGAFTLAIESGRSVVPIVVDGSLHALPREGILLRQREPLDLLVQVLPPIAPEGFDSAEQMAEAVRERMAVALREARQRPGRAPLR